MLALLVPGVLMGAGGSEEEPAGGGLLALVGVGS